MVKKRVKKKVVRKAKKHKHDKSFIITLISLFAVLVIFLLFIFADNFVGKSLETNLNNTNDSTCIDYCKFSTLFDDFVTDNPEYFVSVIVPENEKVHTTLLDFPVEIVVNSVEEIEGVKYCNFNVTFSDSFNMGYMDNDWFIEYLGISKENFNNFTFTIGESISWPESSLSSYYLDNNFILDILKLEEIGCQSCIDIDDDNDMLPDYTEYGQYEMDIDNHSNLLDYSFKGGYALDSTGKIEDSCESDNVIKEAICDGGVASFVENECPEDLACVDGVCVQCKENSFNDGYKEIGLKNQYFISENEFSNFLYIESLHTGCKDNKTLIEYSCSENKIEIEESSCSGDCHIASGRGICFDGCIDEDETDNIYNQTQITGLRIKGYGDNYKDEVTIEEDGCLNEKVVEKYCEEGYIQDKLVDCPEGYSCDDGACVQPKIFNIWDSSKTGVGLEPLENISIPFWVIILLKGEDEQILQFKRTLYPNATEDMSFFVSAYYPYKELIKKKEVIVYDVDDPNQWQVYLNKPFVKVYDDES